MYRHADKHSRSVRESLSMNLVTKTIIHIVKYFVKELQRNKKIRSSGGARTTASVLSDQYITNQATEPPNWIVIFDWGIPYVIEVTKSNKAVANAHQSSQKMFRLPGWGIKNTEMLVGQVHSEYWNNKYSPVNVSKKIPQYLKRESKKIVIFSCRWVVFWSLKKPPSEPYPNFLKNF